MPIIKLENVSCLNTLEAALNVDGIFDERGWQEYAYLVHSAECKSGVLHRNIHKLVDPPSHQSQGLNNGELEEGEIVDSDEEFFEHDYNRNQDGRAANPANSTGNREETFTDSEDEDNESGHGESGYYEDLDRGDDKVDGDWKKRVTGAVCVDKKISAKQEFFEKVTAVTQPPNSFKADENNKVMEMEVKKKLAAVLKLTKDMKTNVEANVSTCSQVSECSTKLECNLPTKYSKLIDAENLLQKAVEKQARVTKVQTVMDAKAKDQESLARVAYEELIKKEKAPFCLENCSANFPKVMELTKSDRGWQKGVCNRNYGSEYLRDICADTFESEPDVDFRRTKCSCHIALPRSSKYPKEIGVTGLGDTQAEALAAAIEDIKRVAIRISKTERR